MHYIFACITNISSVWSISIVHTAENHAWYITLIFMYAQCPFCPNVSLYSTYPFFERYLHLHPYGSCFGWAKHQIRYSTRDLTWSSRWSWYIIVYSSTCFSGVYSFSDNLAEHRPHNICSRRKSLHVYLSIQVQRTGGRGFAVSRKYNTSCGSRNIRCVSHISHLCKILFTLHVYKCVVTYILSTSF